MFVNPTLREHDLERSQTKSLLFLVASLVVANVILVIGFTQMALAQPVSQSYAVMDLARMLAAPETGLGQTNYGVIALIAGGFIVMATACFLFVRNLVDDADRAVVKL